LLLIDSGMAIENNMPINMDANVKGVTKISMEELDINCEKKEY
jgi:hypothetical protein